MNRNEKLFTGAVAGLAIEPLATGIIAWNYYENHQINDAEHGLVKAKEKLASVDRLPTEENPTDIPNDLEYLDEVRDRYAGPPEQKRDGFLTLRDGELWEVEDIHIERPFGDPEQIIADYGQDVKDQEENLATVEDAQLSYAGEMVKDVEVVTGAVLALGGIAYAIKRGVSRRGTKPPTPPRGPGLLKRAWRSQRNFLAATPTEASAEDADSDERQTAGSVANTD